MKLKPMLVCKIILILVILTGIFFATMGRKFFKGKETFQSDLEHQGSGQGFQSGYQRALPGQNCDPKCRYVCSDPVVEQEAVAVCKPAKGIATCDEISPASCTVKCDEPVCYSECFKSEANCGSGSCPKCFTRCAEPKCSVKCCPPKPKCRSVPKKSDCKFIYKTPSKLPKPICKLHCDKDENLLDKVGF